MIDAHLSSETSSVGASVEFADADMLHHVELEVDALTATTALRVSSSACSG